MGDLLGPILPHTVPFTLVLARVTGLFLLAPIIQGSGVPRQVRVLLSVSFAAAIYPTLQTNIFPAPDVSLFAYIPLMFAELAVGFTLGLFALLPLIGLQMAGYVMGYQMGLALAESFNPELDLQSDVIGQLLFYMGSIAFILAGGVEAMFLAIADSFASMPPGVLHADITPLDLLAGLVTAMTDLALRLATPVLAVIALVMVTLGFVMKTIPQVNVMTVGFTIKILVGIGTVAAVLAVLGNISDEYIVDTLDVIRTWAAGG